MNTLPNNNNNNNEQNNEISEHEAMKFFMEQIRGAHHADEPQPIVTPPVKDPTIRTFVVHGDQLPVQTGQFSYRMPEQQ